MPLSARAVGSAGAGRLERRLRGSCGLLKAKILSRRLSLYLLRLSIVGRTR